MDALQQFTVLFLDFNSAVINFRPITTCLCVVDLPITRNWMVVVFCRAAALIVLMFLQL